MAQNGGGGGECSNPKCDKTEISQRCYLCKPRLERQQERLHQDQRRLLLDLEREQKQCDIWRKADELSADPEVITGWEVGPGYEANGDDFHWDRNPDGGYEWPPFFESKRVLARLMFSSNKCFYSLSDEQRALINSNMHNVPEMFEDLSDHRGLAYDKIGGFHETASGDGDGTAPGTCSKPGCGQTMRHLINIKKDRILPSGSLGFPWSCHLEQCPQHKDEVAFSWSFDDRADY
jgi:hypothetical protein